jgi:hypothetical protein
MVAYECYEATSTLNHCGATRRDSLSEWVLDQIHYLQSISGTFGGDAHRAGCSEPHTGNSRSLN